MPPIRTAKRDHHTALDTKQGLLSTFGFTRWSAKTRPKEEDSASEAEEFFSAPSSPQLVVSQQSLSIHAEGPRPDQIKAITVQAITPCPVQAVPPRPALPKRGLPIPPKTSAKDAVFDDDRYGCWEREYPSKIGNSTRKLIFGNQFVMSE